MRLLNAKTLEVVEFSENELPPYAILSHTWGKEEVSYQEMRGGECRGKKGYQKIWRLCHEVTSNGIGYVWVDTCCI